MCSVRRAEELRRDASKNPAATWPRTSQRRFFATASDTTKKSAATRRISLQRHDEEVSAAFIAHCSQTCRVPAASLHTSSAAWKQSSSLLAASPKRLHNVAAEFLAAWPLGSSSRRRSILHRVVAAFFIASSSSRRCRFLHRVAADFFIASLQISSSRRCRFLRRVAADFFIASLQRSSSRHCSVLHRATAAFFTASLQISSSVAADFFVCRCRFLRLLLQISSSVAAAFFVCRCSFLRRVDADFFAVLMRTSFSFCVAEDFFVVSLRTSRRTPRRLHDERRGDFTMNAAETSR